MGQKALNPEEIDNAIAQVIADAIRERGVTAIKISQLSGVPRSTLSDLLRGKRAFYVQQFQKISRALGIPAHDLYRRAEALLSTSTTPEPEPAPAPISSLDRYRENVPPVSPVELDLSRWNVAAYTIGERDGELEYP